MATGLDKIQQKLKETYGKKLNELRNGKKTMWNANEGDHDIRVLPPWNGEDGLFYKEVQQHYGLGNDKNLSAVCPGSETCPICKKCAIWSNSSSPKKQKKADRLSAKTRIMLNIVLVDAPKQNLVWSVSPSLLQELLALTLNPDYGEFWNPRHGYNLKVTRTGTKLATRWKIFPSKNESRLKTWKKYLRGKLINLDTKFKPLEESKLKALLRGENPYERRSDDDE